MVPSGLIFGYHDCHESLTREVVLRHLRLQRSTNGYDWLGEGICFWADDSVRAREWATDSQGQRLAKPSVVGAAIDMGNCLDLAERIAVGWVAEAHAYLQASMAESGRADEMPRNYGGRRELDNRVMESLHSLRAAKALPPRFRRPRTPPPKPPPNRFNRLELQGGPCDMVTSSCPRNQQLPWQSLIAR